MNKKITIVSLGTSRKENPYQPSYLYTSPAGLHYINVILRKQGFETTIVNQVTDNLTLEEIPGLILKANPDIVLFNQFHTTREKIKTVIQALPKTYIFGIGGHDATFHALGLIDSFSNPVNTAFHGHPIVLNPESPDLGRYYKNTDFIWLGEAENGIADFLKSIRKQKSPLLAYNLHNRTRDLDSLPVLDHDDYRGETAVVITSRGCFKKGCDFCTTPQFYPDGWIGRSVDHVSAELANIKNQGKKHVCFFDDNFFGMDDASLARGRQILETCKAIGLKCMIMTSVRQVIRADELGNFNDMAGTVTCAFIGVENPARTSLKKLGKKTSYDENKAMSVRAIDALMHNEIMPYLGYLNFQPETTMEELRESARFLHETNMEGAYFHYLFNRLELLEGTPLCSNYKSSDRIKIEPETGKINYAFVDKKVAYYYAILNLISNNARQLDYYIYEAGQLIFANKLLKTPIGDEYLTLKRSINEFNYGIFMDTLIQIENEDSTGAIINIMDRYKKDTETYMTSFNKLFPTLITGKVFININYS